MLQEAVTGARPFDARSKLGHQQQILTRAPMPPRRLSPGTAGGARSCDSAVAGSRRRSAAISEPLIQLKDPSTVRRQERPT